MCLNCMLMWPLLSNWLLSFCTLEALYAFICFQTLPYAFICFHTLSNALISSHMLSNASIRSHTLSYAFICVHTLPYAFIHFYTLSKCFGMLLYALIHVLWALKAKVSPNNNKKLTAGHMFTGFSLRKPVKIICSTDVVRLLFHLYHFFL